MELVTVWSLGHMDRISEIYPGYGRLHRLHVYTVFIVHILEIHIVLLFIVYNEEWYLKKYSPLKT